MEIKLIKAELLTKKEELEARLERTHKHIHNKEEPVSANFNEQIKQTENDGIVLTLESEGLDELNQVKNALRRVDAGEYLICSDCGKEIGEDRLLAIPYTSLCIQCTS